MNTTARRLTPLTLTAATLAALFLLHNGPTVVQLEPVHVTGQRVPAATVVRGPLVEVTARRADERGLQVVQLPAVEATARRTSDATRVVAQQRAVAVPARNPV